MKRFLIAASSALLLASTPLTADTTTDDMIQMQFSMQQFIEERSVEGAIVNLDLSSGLSEKLYAIESHPMVIELQDSYVLCSDLAKEDGSTVPIDVYIYRNGDAFEVIRFEVNNREPLERLMSLGFAKRLR